MRLLKALPLLIFISGCAYMPWAPVYWHKTRSEDRIRLDYLKCKNKNDGANLKPSEQDLLVRACMKKKGYKYTTREKAKKLDRKYGRR